MIIYDFMLQIECIYTGRKHVNILNILNLLGFQPKTFPSRSHSNDTNEANVSKECHTKMTKKYNKQYSFTELSQFLKLA